MDGGGGGGGDQPDYFAGVSFGKLLWAIALLLMFLALIYYCWMLLALLPLRPSWAAHFRFNSKFRYSPLIVLSVLYVTNSGLPTWLIHYFYTPRMFASYLAAILGVTYTAIYTLAAPRKLIDALRDGTSVDRLDDSCKALLFIRPKSRYLLMCIGCGSMLIVIWLTLLLVPNSFAKAPEDWWTIFWPKL